MRAQRTIDAGLVLIGLALPLSLAATNLGLGILSLGILAALYDPGTRSISLSDLRDAARTPLFAALLAYAAAALLSALSGVDPGKSFAIWPKDLHKLWVVLSCGAALDTRRRRMFTRALTAGTVGAALVGIAQTLSAALVIVLADSGWVSVMGLSYLRAHAFIHPVSYGEILGLVFLGLVFVGRTELPDRAGWKAAAAVGIAVVLNQTRAVLLGLMTGFTLIGALLPRWRRTFALLTGSAVAVFAAWDLLPMGRSLKDLFAFHGPQAARLTLWRVGWEIFRDHPWTGAGPGHYRTLFPSYFTGLLDGERVWGSAHNLFIHQAAERGLVGLAALAAVIGAIGLGAWRRFRSEPDGWALWSICACTSFLVMNMTETAFQTEQVATLFLILVLLPAARPARVEFL